MKFFIKLLKISTLLLILSQNSFAVVTGGSVIVTAATPTNIGGTNYYLANKNYSFRVQASSADNILKSEWNSITLEIWNGASAQHSVTISIDTDSQTASSNLTTVNIVDNSNFAAGNLDYQITVKIPWDSATEITSGAYNIRAVVSDDDATSVPGTSLQTYGTCASIKIMNFAQSGNAADGKVNQLNDPFNVTGTLVYNVPSATILDIIPASEITSITLRRNGTGVGINDTLPSFTLSVPDDHFNGPGPGNYTWDVEVDLNSSATNEIPAQTLAIRCDRVAITNIEVIGGGGINSSPDFFRSTTTPGVQIRVTAAMQAGGGNVEGNTTVRIAYDYGAGLLQTDVTILSGNATGVANITYPTVASNNALAPGSYTINYRAAEIVGGPYDESLAGNGQHVFTDINQDLTPIQLYWENADAPGLDSNPFTNGTPGDFSSSGQTQNSVILQWTALSLPKDGDFDSYRIYYKKTSSSTWLMIDRSTAGAYASLGTIGTGSIEITGLAISTSYDFRLSAIDVFGNEVLITYQPGFSISTQPATVNVTVSDGITVLNDPSLLLPNPNYELRYTNIKVTATIVTNGNRPNLVRMILENNGAEPGLIDILTPTNTVDFTYAGRNKWVAYIPDSNALIALNTEVRFIIRIEFDTVPTFVDNNSENNDGDYNDQEWRFYINNPATTTFTPWPTRILNNVITSSNPTAYPAYYLSEDANVTMKIYDIKGRVIVTLMDNAYRKGGQNIKDQGWSGINKAGRSVGPGLYFIHIKATSTSSGAVIINQIKKIMVAR